MNPIDFENCEGNLGMANSVMKHFAEKLPISRYQRDLSDSTVMRNHGIAFGYSLVGYKSLVRGLDKIEVNPKKLSADLNSVKANLITVTFINDLHAYCIISIGKFSQNLFKQSCASTA